MKHMRARICMPFCLALVCVAVLANSSRAITVNLLTNPGFEDAGGSYNGWFTFGAGVQLSTPADDDIYRSGVAAAKIYGEFTNCPLPTFDVGGFGQAFTPVAGNIYSLSGYSFVSNADSILGTNTCTGNRLVAKVVFFDAAVGGNEIASSETVIGDQATPLDQWIVFNVSAPAPAGALRVEAIFLFLQPGCDTGSVFVDDVTLYELSPPAAGANQLVNPSFTGNLTGWTTFGNCLYDGRTFARRTPTGGAKLFSTFVPASDSGMYQEIAAAPGSDWQLEAYVLTTCQENPIMDANQNVVVATISFRDAMDAEIGVASDVILDNTAPLGKWTRHTVVGTAPAGTVAARAYILFVSPALEGGAAWVDDVYFGAPVATGVEDRPVSLGFQLHQNVPNPFSPQTRIDFDLDQADNVSVTVYDVRGRRVATLLEGRLGSGPHSATWDGRSADGRSVSSGVYWSVLQTSTGKESRRMVLIR